ncbi:MAG: pyridoxamine 5'-phosphate oxidase family protein [Chloroflexi bacterium]|nr:pyridoxamine 5'-phosphate oxidase family protein [Chloroflexota bacterium]
MIESPVSQHAVSTEDLNERFGLTSPKARIKKRAEVDEHGARFIGQSPFCVMATASAGACDASPKGGNPGFVLVAAPKTLLIPDYPGNRLFDGMRNLLENPRLGLLFMIPGENWTFRVNGAARIRDDAETLERLRDHDPKGKAPLLAIELTVEECFFHCPKSYVAADLWNPDKHQQFDDLPAMFRA